MQGFSPILQCIQWEASELQVFGNLYELKTQGFILAHLLYDRNNSCIYEKQTWKPQWKWQYCICWLLKAPSSKTWSIPKPNHRVFLWLSHLFLGSIQVITCKTFQKSVLFFFRCSNMMTKNKSRLIISFNTGLLFEWARFVLVWSMEPPGLLDGTPLVFQPYTHSSSWKKFVMPGPKIFLKFQIFSKRNLCIITHKKG